MTLMVLTVSAIFGICWGIESAFHIVDDFVSKLSPVFFLISHTMVTFNSAVNPFAYALINQRFREKMKRMVCHLSSSDEKPSLSRERKEMDTCIQQRRQTRSRELKTYRGITGLRQDLPTTSA